MNKLFEELKTSLGPHWLELTDEEVETLKEVATNASALAVEGIRGDDISNDAKHVVAQLANVKSIGSKLAQDALIYALGKTLKTVAQAFVV